MGWDFQYPNNMSVFTFFDLPTSILAPQSMALFEAKLQKVSWSNLLLLLELDTRSSLNYLEIRFWKLFPPWNNWLILTAAIAKGQVFLGFFCSGCFLDTFLHLYLFSQNMKCKCDTLRFRHLNLFKPFFLDLAHHRKWTIKYAVNDLIAVSPILCVW